jgi:hypothetical protein
MKGSFAAVFLCLVGGCAGPDVPMAPMQSPHFEAVSSELHLGGTVYAYADIDGDAERAADFLLTLLRDMPELLPQRGTTRLNATALVRILGLHAVKAVGLSSYESGELYHNRSFIHHTGPREGLLRVFGGEPADFGILDIAPAGADMVWEQQLDVGAVVDVIRELGELGVGLTPEELDEVLGERVLELDITLAALVERLKTTAALVLVLDESRNLWIPGESFTFPYIDFLLRVEGLEPLADAIVDRAASDPFIRSQRTEGWIIMSPAIRLPPPWNAYEPSVIKEVATGRLYVVSSPGFLKECLATATRGVAQTDEFMRAFDGLPERGNGLTYFSPRMTRQMHAVLDQIIAANGSTILTTISRFFMPDAGYPVGWMAKSKEHGLLFTSNTASSHKSTLLTLGYAALLPAAAVIGASMLAPAEDDEAVTPPF